MADSPTIAGVLIAALAEGKRSDEDYQRFSLRLQHCLVALRELLARPGFGAGAPSIGAEPSPSTSRALVTTMSCAIAGVAVRAAALVAMRRSRFISHLLRPVGRARNR